MRSIMSRVAATFGWTLGRSVHTSPAWLLAYGYQGVRITTVVVVGRQPRSKANLRHECATIATYSLRLALVKHASCSPFETYTRSGGSWQNRTAKARSSLSVAMTGLKLNVDVAADRFVAYFVSIQSLYFRFLYL